MKTEYVTIGTGNNAMGAGTVTYKEGTVFAFNPLYIELDLTTEVRTLNVQVTGPDARGVSLTRVINVQLYNGKAKVYYSGLVQLFFYDVLHSRSVQLTISLWYGSSIKVLQFNQTVLWGCIALGDRFNSLGTFHFDKSRPYFERRRVWFKNFPFCVTMLAAQTGMKNYANVDWNGYTANPRMALPQVTTIMENYENIEYDALVEMLPEGNVVEEVYFFSDPQEQRFVALDDHNNLCLAWGESPGVYPSTRYNGSNGKALPDVLCAHGDTVMFYDTVANVLKPRSYGRDFNLGLSEIFPSTIFPDAVATVMLKQEGTNTGSRFSVFDNTFDFTFFLSGENTFITTLEVSNATAGYYLRWIDRYGCLQFYLFDKGKQTTKNKASGNEALSQELNGDTWFGNHTRDTSLTAVITRKCCATALDDEIYAYVSSIVTSPVIDLYMGKTRGGQELWAPVKIVEANHDFQPSDLLHNLEISFTMPDVASQSL